MNNYFDEFRNSYYDSLFLPFKEAIEDLDLIQRDDKIMVCISGGKDSMLLAKLFQYYQSLNPYFSLVFLVMNPGYKENHLELIKQNLKTLEIDAVIENSTIFKVASDISENPCYLCARMRRGYLYSFAVKYGCNKIALGHHADDVAETLLMGIINSGNVQTMLASLDSTSYPGLKLIRPLYYVREKDICKWRDDHHLVFLACACEFTSKVEDELIVSKRKETKDLIKRLEVNHPDIVKNLIKTGFNVDFNHILGYKLGEEKIEIKKNDN